MKKYGIPFLVLSAGLIASDRKTGELLPNTIDQQAWSGRASEIGASYTLAGFTASTWLFGKAIHNDHLSEAGSLSLQAFAHTQIMIQGLKFVTQRERPLEDDQRGGFFKGGDSFPSGHAASSFAVATVFAYEYRNHLAVPIVAYSLAGVVAASRMGAQRHWVSDIAIGSGIGFLLGRYTYKRHHDNGLPGSPVERRSKLIPDFGVGQRGGFSLNWQL